MYGPGDVQVEDVPDPTIQRPTDAIVRVSAACVCGSDLWAYRGIRELSQPTRYGHEFVGVVEEVGIDVRTVRAGDFVVAPFSASDNTCVHCRNGVTTSCEKAAFWGGVDADGLAVDGAQGEAVRVPVADGTLVATPDQPGKELIPDLLTLTDVMATGHHAAVLAGVAPGQTVVVVGDGAVGLCAVLAAKRLGAERIIAMSRHTDRQRVATEFGATDIVVERGEEGVARVQELLGGLGADAVLECVGMQQAMEQAIAATRPGGRIGCVGIPAGISEFPFAQLFRHNRTIGAGTASVRAYLPELLAAVLDDSIQPGRVFDLELPLEQVPEAYAAMDERRSIKTLLWP